ncbi:MAG: hypothetical protein JO354_13455 [Verrucomicrobia bacterium]|nr:hypothetical protein [Verrucomicrobiota bacterium]
MNNGSSHELRFTETNSADDSAGKTWGLEGNLFWFIVGGAFVSVVSLLLLFSVSRWTLLSALVPSLVPTGLALLYVFTFRQGKPRGYDTDLFELWLKGRGFGPETVRVTAHLTPASNHV